MFGLSSFSLLELLDPSELPIFEVFVGLIVAISNGITDFGESSCFVKFVLPFSDSITDAYSFLGGCSDSGPFVEFSFIGFSAVFESVFLTFCPLFSSYLLVAFSIPSCVVASFRSVSSFFVVTSSVDDSGFESILCLFEFLSLCSFSLLRMESVAGGSGLYGGIGRLFPPESN